MANITVKNIPDDLYKSLKRVAGKNRRSINNEIIVCIERALGGDKIAPDKILARARQLRQSIQTTPISDAEFSKAKRAGRP